MFQVKGEILVEEILEKNSKETPEIPMSVYSFFSRLVGALNYIDKLRFTLLIVQGDYSK